MVAAGVQFAVVLADACRGAHHAFRQALSARGLTSNLPPNATQRQLVAIIKARWSCEQGQQQLKEELGLDHFGGRTWRAAPPRAADYDQPRLPAAHPPRRGQSAEEYPLAPHRPNTPAIAPGGRSQPSAAPSSPADSAPTPATQDAPDSWLYQPLGAYSPRASG